MSNQWEYFPCSIGDNAASISVDVGMKTALQSGCPSLLATVTLKYRHVYPNGLPSRDEFEPVRALEARLEQFAKANGDWYVGRVTVAARRQFYIYTTQGEAAWNAFVQALETEFGYELEFSHREDAGYSGYWEDLSPGEDDWRVIKDLRVIEALEREGDDGTLCREVDHWVYFDRQEQAIAFVQWAESDRFTEARDFSGSTPDGNYCVRLRHHGTMDLKEITSHTIALRRKAVEFGGHYDGWETPVLRPG